MTAFKLNRVGAIFVKHYAENYVKYLAMYGMSIAIPMIFGFISKNGDITRSMLITMMVIDIFVIVHLSVNPLRERRRAVIENTLPVTLAERYAFVMINTIAVFAACFAVTALICTCIIDSLYPPIFDLTGVLLRKGHLCLGMCCTHAVALMINALARRRLILAYAAAFFATLLVQFIIMRAAGLSCIDEAKMYANIAVAVILWPAAYFVLRSKQIKW